MEKVPLMPLPSPVEREKLRKQMGLTYQRAAQEIGVSPRTLWRWEHGENTIHPDNHRKYQKALTRWKQIVDTWPDR